MEKENERKELTGYPSIDMPHLKNYPKGAYEAINNGIHIRMYDFMYNKNRNALENIAMEYFGIKIPYQKMIENIAIYAKAFKKYGIQKGDFVTICLPNIPELVYIKYALNRIGAIANLVDPRTNSNGILERVNFTQSKLFITISDICQNKLNPIINKFNLDNIVTITPADSLPKNIKNQTKQSFLVNEVYSIKKLYQKQLENFMTKKIYLPIQEFLQYEKKFEGTFDVPYEENMPVTALYTSGTTADTMSAGLFTNENYNAMVNNMSYGSKYIQTQKRFLGAIPFFSAYGSFCGFHHSFSNSWNVIMVPKFKPEKYAQLILNTKSNAALGVPKFWEQLPKLAESKSIDTSHIEIPVTGGDWISQASINSINNCFKKTGSKVNLKIGYGATEFGGVVSTTSDDKDKYNPNSVGILLPGNSAMIINPNTGEELKYNQEGELCISSPTMMLEYLNDSAKTNKIIIYKNGKKYYRTGDKMKINENGDLIFCDRYKRVMMRPDGHTVACTPIENVILSLNNVENCAVVGLKQDENSSGVIPTAFIQLKKQYFQNYENYEEIVSKIDNYCLEHLGERERALAFIFLEKIPYTLNGKIDFRTLEKYNLNSNYCYKIQDILFENSMIKKKKLKRF